MSATVYDKHKDELGNEKSLALGTIIACAGGTILLVIFLIIFIQYFRERLVEEDRFITSMSRVATEPASAADIRSSFGEYLNKSLGTDKFTPDDIRKFGNLLASKQTTIYGLGEDNMPSYFQDRLGTTAKDAQELIRNTRNRVSQSYTEGFQAGVNSTKEAQLPPP